MGVSQSLCLVACAGLLGGCGLSSLKGMYSSGPEEDASASYACRPRGIGTNEPVAAQEPLPAKCQIEDIVPAYNNAMRVCRDLQAYYEQHGSYSKAGHMTLATLGSLAGAVFSPISKGSTAVAWSGFSGSVNALQSTWDQQFSYAIIVKIRMAIAKASDDTFKHLSEISLGDADPSKEVLEANIMAHKCLMAPAKAEEDMLRKITDGGGGGGEAGEAGKKDQEEPKPVAAKKSTP